jgi:hypothetical protein
MASKDILAANPQGKASIAILDDLHTIKPANIKSKKVTQWFTDYFTSILVLSAKFSFKPVINNRYYLYLDHKEWRLSLIEPHAWDKCPYIFFAECSMCEDKSWSLQPFENWQENIQLNNKVSEMQKNFFNSLNTPIPIIETLPYFVGNLPYYQRVAANGLANSLKQSLLLQLGLEQSNRVSGKILIAKLRDNCSSTIGLLSIANHSCAAPTYNQRPAMR